MAVHPNETLIRQLYTAFNSRKHDEAVKLASDRFEWRDVATGEIYRGPAGPAQFMERWVNTFDNAKVDVQRIVATDPFVAEIVGRGPHRAPRNAGGNDSRDQHAARATLLRDQPDRKR
jgi:hypothetical protein